jgi:class 3 adenylate cyclase
MRRPRLCDRAEAGTILLSHVVKGLTFGKGYHFVDRGSATLKGFAEEVAVAELTWRQP